MLGKGLLPYWWMIYRHAKLVGQRTDIFRNVEDSYAAKQGDLCLSRGRVHVDIGSGSSPLPTFLCRRCGSITYATECDRVYLKRQKSYAKALKFNKSEQFHVQPEDATQLSFGTGSVDFVSAVSTIEHIPSDGDIRVMAEFARVLRPGGRVVVTVPASAEYVENQSTFYYSGFERRYSAAALKSRLYHPDLALLDEGHMVPPPADFTEELRREFPEIFGGPNPAEVWYRNQWHDQYPDVSILMTLGMIRISSDPAGSFGAMLTFERK